MEAPGLGRAVRGRRLPALDGVRAVAVAGVVAYHLRLGWAPGGYLGVDLFFVLSGFLITGLLLEEAEDTGRVRLGAFWARRARRLLPALLLLLAVLAVAGAAGALVSGSDLRALRGDALATLAYGANWHQLAAGQGYFGQFQAPSPLGHTWSLAIEEQFYLVWPLLLVGFLGVRAAATGRAFRRGTPWRARMLGATVAAAVASAAWMGWLAAHASGLDRLYYGTDTRAFDLLAGAALAAVCAARPDPGPRARRVLHVAGPLAAGILAVLWARGGGPAGPPRLMFEGGMALAAVAGVVVLADARLAEPGPLGRVLRIAPLRYLGRISYGVYLWHWPVITELTAARTGVSGAALDVLQVATTLCLAEVSYHALEQPLRRARFSRWPAGLRVAVAPVGMALTALAVLAVVPVDGAQAAAGTGGAPGARLAGARATGAVVPGSQVPGAGGLGTQVPVRLPAGRVVSPAHPLRVLLLGDSVLGAEAPALGAALAATGAAELIDASYPGWGLSTDATWAADLPGLLARDRPDLVVAMWSWDDDQVLSRPSAYRATLRAFVSELLDPGHGAPGVAGVLFEQYPPLLALPGATDQAAQQKRVAGATAWSAMVASLPARFPGRVQYLPLAAAVERRGAFATWLPPAADPSAAPRRWVRIRMVDETHFCPAGAARYADGLVTDLQALAGLPPPASTWWDGNWSTNTRYRAASGACPDDHPR